MIIKDLLVITHGNQSKAAAMLNINRGTFRGYMEDVEGHRHHIKKVGEKYQFFALLDSAGKNHGNTKN